MRLTGSMRKTHRWIALLACIFMAIIAATGVYLQGDILWDAYFPDSQPAGATLPIGAVSTFAAKTAAEWERSGGDGENWTSLRLRLQGSLLRADVTSERAGARTVFFDAETGEAVGRFVPSGDIPKSARERRWSLLMSLHRGDVIGVAGNWLGFAIGLALLVLAITGLAVYVQLYRQRLRLRKTSPFW